MRNDLLTAMSADMHIIRYHDETDDEFIYRLCYSALGQWALRISQNSTDDMAGSTKLNQTIVLNELLATYSNLFPNISNKFIDTRNYHKNFPVAIRRVYEETGYLLTDNKNCNHIANYGRSMKIGSKRLLFGVPDDEYSVNGLGVFSNKTAYEISTRELLIRDDLTCEEYFLSRYDPIEFYDRDIDIDELEFFNPLSNQTPSQSWCKSPRTDCTVARATETGPFYRVMMMPDGLQFADERVEAQSYKLTSHEYHRLYFALKAHYGNPLKAVITKYDEEYSRLRVWGHLPNREYYFLLLLSWPETNAFDKVNFIMRNDMIQEVTTVLMNIGVDIEGGRSNG